MLKDIQFWLKAKDIFGWIVITVFAIFCLWVTTIAVDSFTDTTLTYEQGVKDGFRAHTKSEKNKQKEARYQEGFRQGMRDAGWNERI